MLFNSYTFILIFFPLVLFGVYGINKFFGHNLAIYFLLMMSFIFYGHGQEGYLTLIIFSIIFNFLLGRQLANLDEQRVAIRKILLILGIAGNLGTLSYFKYMNFFISNIESVFDVHMSLLQVSLPLGISFFTFQQIAYLVDAYKETSKAYGFKDYALFVTFFPHLIAGPLVYHKEIIRQFEGKSVFNFNPNNIIEGFVLFSIGLFKKVILADGIAQYANLVFGYVDSGGHVSFLVAWCGILAYTFEIYFDFSGYSDMAIGLARILGIRLPCNFNSPYKSISIIDFWRRWNMTLSRFLKNYLYIALGGNRKGKVRRYFNLMATMVLGGLWHGASWNFIFWGFLHGLFLCVNHAWRALFTIFNLQFNNHIVKFGRVVSHILTFVAVVVAWVFFRAKSFSTAVGMLQGMFLCNGVSLPPRYQAYMPKLTHSGIVTYNSQVDYLFTGRNELFFILISFIVISLPNSQQFISKYFFGKWSEGFELSAENGICTLRYGWIMLFSFVFMLCMLLSSKPDAFIYFKF